MLKLANEGKRKLVGEGMSRRILEKIMKACYGKIFCFIGLRRFDAINKVKKENVEIRDVGRVKVWVEKARLILRENSLVSC